MFGAGMGMAHWSVFEVSNQKKIPDAQHHV